MNSPSGTHPSEAVNADDETLLAEYLHGHSHAAFAGIARRHAEMVLATCRRLLGPAHPSVDDACQAVFVLLSRNARQIRDGRAVASWLHQAARRICMHVVREDCRRKRRERVAAEDVAMKNPAVDSDAYSELIDEGISRLSDVQREAVICYFFEGHSQAESARILGCSEGAIKKRIADATAVLRAFFSRRGASVAVLMAGLALSRTSHAAVDSAIAAGCAAAADGGSGAAKALAHDSCRRSFGAKSALAGASLVAIGTMVSFTLYRPPGRDDLPRASKHPPSSQSVAATSSSLPAQWNFSAGPAGDIEQVVSRWNWGRRPDDGSGVMIVKPDEIVVVQFPQSLQPRPTRLRIRYAPVEKHHACLLDGYRSDGHGALRSTNKLISVEYSRAELDWDIYFFDRYAVRYSNGKVRSVRTFEKPYAGDRLCVAFDNVFIAKIEMTYLDETEIPEAMRNPSALAREEEAKAAAPTNLFESWDDPDSL